MPSTLLGDRVLWFEGVKENTLMGISRQARLMCCVDVYTSDLQCVTVYAYHSIGIDFTFGTSTA